MARNEYHFVTNWRVQGTVREVAEIIADAPGLARWWPSVYLDVQELEPGDEHGIGKVVDLYTKGWLPYTLRWKFRVTERTPKGFVLEAQGDFDGRGEWTFEQDRDYVNITYDWRIRADKPLLRTLSPIMKPIFAWNHHWAMARGYDSLLLEMRRRRAGSDAARAAIPAPPPATSAALPIGFAAALLLAGVYLRHRASKR